MENLNDIKCMVNGKDYYINEKNMKTGNIKTHDYDAFHNVTLLVYQIVVVG
jgi:hypothetical protein